MLIAAVVTSVLFALGNIASASFKFRRDPRIVAAMGAVGVRPDQLWMLGTVQVAGALGLLIGLFWSPLALAAAVGFVLYFLGALGAHARAKDPAYQPALVMFVLAVVVLVLRVLAL